MIINENQRVPENPVELEGAKHVTIKILIGSEEGSRDIIMRYFKIRPGGYSCLHSHNWEHLVKVERGKGVVIDNDGNERVVTTEHSLFVEPNELHQFKNPFSEAFEFICIIPSKEP
jgi:quercetin dioxygenase-like cupin family protein